MRDDRCAEEEPKEEEQCEGRPGTEGQRRSRLEKGVDVHGTVDQEERKEEQAHGECAIISEYEDRSRRRRTCPLMNIDAPRAGSSRRSSGCPTRRSRSAPIAARRSPGWSAAAADSC